MTDQHLTIRVAKPEDSSVLRQLGELDSRRPLGGYVLIAELAGTPLAALSLETGTVTADPFQPTADAVHLLRLRRYQIVRQGRDVAPVRSLLRRFVPDPAT
jgi:hypothetical protein